jgi:hypothetical protein
LLAQCDQSGQSVKSFCTSHNIIAHGTFYNWKHKKKNGNKELGGFAPVQVIPSVSVGLFAEVGNIRIYQPVTAAYLKGPVMSSVILLGGFATYYLDNYNLYFDINKAKSC